MKRFFLTGVVWFACLLTWGQSSVINRQIQSIMDRYDAIGASVYVVKDNKIAYSGIFGYNPDYNHPELRTPIKDDDIFWIGSISKSIVGVAIMQLVEHGSVDLDEDVSNYLPFKVRSPLYPEDPITVRMLLCHRSALNDNQYGWTFNQLNTEDSSRYKKNFNSYRPGSKTEYSNLGYSVLASVVELVSGIRFDEYINRNLISKIGATGSYNLLDIDSTRLVRAYNYDEKKKSFVSSPSIYDYDSARRRLSNYQQGLSTPGFAPAGGMRMTAESLCRYMLMFMNEGRSGFRRVLRRETVHEMEQTIPEGGVYTLGLAKYPGNIIPGITLTGSRGGSHGFHSIMVFDPEQHYGFVVISNGWNTTKVNGSDMNFAIVRALYKEFIQSSK